MDLRRLRIGEWAMALTGLLLVLSLFLSWYSDGGADETAWQALSVTDVFLALLGVAAVAVVPVVARSPTPSPGIAYEALMLLAALIGLVIVLFRVLDPPGDLSRELGAWLGLVAVAALLPSVLAAMRDERVSSPDRPTDSTGVPVAVQPEIETLPAPRP
jgi:hypothetical protein